MLTLGYGIRTTVAFAALLTGGAARADLPSVSIPSILSVESAVRSLEARTATTISAVVRDAAGTPVSGVTVTFQLIAGPAGGAVSPAAASDGSGRATATFQAGSSPGRYTVRATAEGGNRPGAEVTVEVTVPAPHLSRNYFNPDRGERLRIQVEVPDPAAVRVNVLAMTGEVVRRVDAGEFGSGRVSREWDGRSDSGERVPSGMYFVRVEQGTTVHARRVIVVRM